MSDDIVVPGENLEGSTQSPVKHEEIVEARARELGWKPEGEWEGNPAEWVSAKEFVGRQGLFDRIASLRSEITKQREKFEKDFEVVKNYVQQMSKVEYERAVKDLQMQKREAVTQGDVEAVESIDKEIDELRTQRTTTTTPPPQPKVPDEFISWQAKNDWYAKDAVLREQADIIGIGYFTKNPHLSQAQVLEYVEQTIKSQHPDKFGGRKVATVTPVESGGGSPSAGNATGKGTKKFSESDLNDTERQVMITLVKRGVVTKEKYLEDLSKAKGQ